ncbi:hypothetical protein BP6252_13096 [Coleophoma cylindrospora]|uniref:Terpene synthase n=1 Tax=Coleophoma cylindrospora TaxID=1849047 RepID=A0A3D8QAC1_9HELO|nr:hypothetical protein BP6252_13096 [Coleophoma cylindrospora]
MDLYQHQQILSTIRGKTVEIPDIRFVLSKWPRRVNLNYSSVIATADQTIESVFQDDKKIQNLKSANLALFASMSFPDAAIDELEILTLWVIWIYMWDDEVDEPNGLYTNNLESGNLYRKQTLNFAEYHLGLGEHGEVPTSPNPIIDSFRPIGQRFQKCYSVEQCQLVFEELKFAMQMSREEQQARLSDKIPTVNEYMRVRMGSSGVGLLLTALEYVSILSLPSADSVAQVLKPRSTVLLTRYGLLVLSLRAHILGHCGMRQMSSSGCEPNNFLSNDILSLKKKVAADWLANLVSLTFIDCGDLQKAVDMAYAALVAAIDRFEAAAKELLLHPESLTVPEEEAKSLVGGLRDAWVGLIYWQYESRRYFPPDADIRDGHISVTI